MISWRNIDIDKPTDGQECLTRCKHGIIEGVYNAKEEYFEGYYWSDLSWYCKQWVPIEEV